MIRLASVVVMLTLVSAGATARPLPAPRTIISNLDRTFSGVNDYTCFADAHYKKGDEKEDKVYKIYFKKPALVRVEVLEGDGGTVAVLTKEGKVKAHRGGFLAWLVLSLELDNPLVTTIRGHTLRQSHFGYMIERMKGAITNEAVRVSGTQIVDGVKTYVMETPYGPPRDGITRDMVFVDPSTWRIKKIRSFEGGREVIKVTYSDVVINPGLDEGLFDM